MNNEMPRLKWSGATQSSIKAKFLLMAGLGLQSDCTFTFTYNTQPLFNTMFAPESKGLHNREHI